MTIVLAFGAMVWTAEGVLAGVTGALIEVLAGIAGVLLTLTICVTTLVAVLVEVPVPVLAYVVEPAGTGQVDPTQTGA